MKKAFCILAILLSSTTMLCAQYGGNNSIIDDLNTEREGEGRIRIMQDESIQRVIGARHSYATTQQIEPTREDNNALLTKGGEQTKARGWKIQVFSGNNQAQSKQEAESRRSKVRSAFPDLEASITYSAPMWRLRVGNFTSREAAEGKLEEMKHILPSLAREMYVVQEVIKKAVR